MVVKFYANHSYNGVSYIKGKEYRITEEIYNNVKCSCQLIKRITPDRIELQSTGIRNLLIIKYNGIGNVLMGTPLIQKAKELLNCEIDLLVEPGHKSILEGWEVLRNIYDDVTPVLQNEYDLVIVGVPGNFSDNRILNKYKCIVGNKELLKIYHEVEVNINLLCELGWDRRDIPRIYIPTQKTPVHKNSVAVCPGYAKHMYWSKKHWGDENFAELTKELLKRFSYVYIIGGDQDNQFLRFITDKRIIDCTDKTIQENAYILSKCKYAIGNDTGALHMAAAVGTKTIGIFGGTSVQKNYSWGTDSVILQSNRKCVPCQYKSLQKCDNQECLNDIKPFHVVKAMNLKKYDLSVVIPVSNRYEMFVSCLRSLDIKAKYVFIADMFDNKVDKAIREWAELNEVVYLKHLIRYGKEYFAQTVKEGFYLADTEYTFFLNDDFVINPYTEDVIKLSYKYLKEFPMVGLYSDNRIRELKLYKKARDYDDYFDVVMHNDGGMILSTSEYMTSFYWHNVMKEYGSCTWIEIRNQMENREQLRLKESLGEHIGNMHSAMNANVREGNYLYSHGQVKLFSKPVILGDK